MYNEENWIKALQAWLSHMISFPLTPHTSHIYPAILPYPLLDPEKYVLYLHLWSFDWTSKWLQLVIEHWWRVSQKMCIFRI